MTQEWLWLWFSYFKLNKDYEKYCEAKRKENNAAIKRLEKKLEMIEELYEDWGDIHSFDPRKDNMTLYEEWLAKRTHLFFETELKQAAVLKEPPSRFDKNYLYIQVPIEKSVAPAIKAASAQIRKAYDCPAIKKQRGQSTAKYVIEKKLQNDRVLHGTRKALNVWEMFYNVSGKTPTVSEVAKQIEKRLNDKRHNTWSNRWAWKRQQRQRDQSIDDLGGPDPSLARSIKRYKAEATTIINNTLHGKFPMK